MSGRQRTAWTRTAKNRESWRTVAGHLLQWQDSALNRMEQSSVLGTRISYSTLTTGMQEARSPLDSCTWLEGKYLVGLGKRVTRRHLEGRMADIYSRVRNQNGVSLLHIMLQIHHSGREPISFLKRMKRLLGYQRVKARVDHAWVIVNGVDSHEGESGRRGWVIRLGGRSWPRLSDCQLRGWRPSAPPC